MEWFKKFKQGLFTKSQIVVGITLTMLGTSLVVYAVQVLVGMKIFTSGTPISSADVNANFALINKMVEDTNQKFQIGITTSQSFPTYTNFSTALTSVTPLSFETTLYDYTAGTLGKQMVNVGSFTISQTGVYDLTLIGRVSTPTSYTGIITLYKNGTGFHSLYVSSTVNAYGSRYYLESGTVIKVRARNTYWMGGNMTLDPAKTKFILHKL